ncbi:uncharacterized protein LY89DRAFT_584536, partial [Mollisia scopiformis]
LQAYKAILASLIGCSAFHAGCLWAKLALKKYPGDFDLHELSQDLEDAYNDRVRELEADREIDKSELPYAKKSGKIYQKRYPWMNDTLFHRTQDQINVINKEDRTVNWKIKSVIFGPKSEEKKVEKGGDVGPFGMFAKRNIAQGEIIMVDKTVAGISSIPSSKGLHCDNCLAALVYPYITPQDICVPSCCDKVSYCSQKCMDQAMSGYHSQLCGKNFDWIYEHHDVAAGETGETQECRSNWRPIMFLRLMAIVLADLEIFDFKHTNPLQHPVISRMAGNYRDPAPGNLRGVTHDWQFWENVVAPTRVLMELGVDIFSEPVYSQEVIQTVFWRFENNANMAATSITGKISHVMAVNPNYLFLNHSCDPNVSWHGAVPNGSVSIRSLVDRDGKILRPGTSAVWCIAGKKIKKGEELKISYIGDPQGTVGKKNEDRAAKRIHLEKWFDNGCGCDLCEKENKAGGISHEIEAQS